MAVLSRETFSQRMVRLAGRIVERRRRRAELARRRTESLLRVREALSYLNRLGSLKDVPALGDSASAGAELDLSLEERTILARVDGRTSYSQILASSPFTKPDTCRVLSQLLDRGWISPIKSKAPVITPEVRSHVAVEPRVDVSAGLRSRPQARAARERLARSSALKDVAAPDKLLLILRLPRQGKPN